MDKPIDEKYFYVCLPYRAHLLQKEPFVTWVYAGSTDPRTDGDVLKVTYFDGMFVKAELVRIEGENK